MATLRFDKEQLNSTFDQIWPARYVRDIIGKREYVKWEEIKRRGNVRHAMRTGTAVLSSRRVLWDELAEEFVTPNEQAMRDEARGGMSAWLATEVTEALATIRGLIVYYNQLNPCYESSRLMACLARFNMFVQDLGRGCMMPLNTWVDAKLKKAANKGVLTSAYLLAIMENTEALLALFCNHP